tara:strand:+ start:3433 stop:3735 length:303 start_codon:yes stop_codon:yes gene_type:complete
MSSIKNKNLLFLGAALLLAAAYGYYAYNSTDSGSAPEPDSKAVIEVPASSPPASSAEAVIAVPAVKVTPEPLADKDVPLKQVPMTEKVDTIIVAPTGVKE